jgi:MFS transporter, SP family, general alpha glucoside:H+ symporter
MTLMASTIFVLFFAVNVEMLLAGNILCGIPWGIFQTLTTAYAAEICPAAMRGYLTAWVSMCWGAGTFLSTGILRGTIDVQGDAGWRIPYALQWVWIPPLFLVGFLAPESPWYLVRKGRIDDAEKSLRRLARKDFYSDRTMAETLALMKHTNEMEKIEAANSSYLDCFHGTNLRRTGIVCMAWVIQMLNGQSITSFAAVMLKSIGMSTTMAFNYNMAIQSVNIVATGIAITLMGKIGRRVFYFFGSAGIGVCMLIIGIFGFAADKNTAAIGTAAFLIVVQCVFKISLGPTTYVVVAEIASNRVRAQTIVLGRAIYVCCAIIVNQLNPRMLNSTADAWGWGARTGMFYFGLCFIWAIWIWFFLPETKNRSFADIDYLFQKKVNARKFTSTPIDCKYYPVVSTAMIHSHQWRYCSCPRGMIEANHPVTQCSNSPPLTIPPRGLMTTSQATKTNPLPSLARSVLKGVDYCIAEKKSERMCIYKMAEIARGIFIPCLVIVGDVYNTIAFHSKT